MNTCSFGCQASLVTGAGINAVAARAADFAAAAGVSRAAGVAAAAAQIRIWIRIGFSVGLHRFLMQRLDCATLICLVHVTLVCLEAYKCVGEVPMSDGVMGTFPCLSPMPYR
jgi:hypothetical protein